MIRFSHFEILQERRTLHAHQSPANCFLGKVGALLLPSGRCFSLVNLVTLRAFDQHQLSLLAAESPLRRASEMI